MLAVTHVLYRQQIENHIFLIKVVQIAGEAPRLVSQAAWNIWKKKHNKKLIWNM